VTTALELSAEHHRKSDELVQLFSYRIAVNLEPTGADTEGGWGMHPPTSMQRIFFRGCNALWIEVKTRARAASVV